MINKKPKHGYGYIYKYTSPSGKSYIGQTTDSLYKRAGGPNGKRYNKCPIFYNAIKKYGFRNFDVEILAEVPINQLNLFEKKYIELFNTIIPYGYNANNGGEARGTKKVYQYNSVTGEFIKDYESITEAAKEINKESQGIVDCTHGRKLTCGGYCWSLQKLKKYPVYEKQELLYLNNNPKSIYAYDSTNKLIAQFDSITKAAEWCNGERSAIKRCCRHELKTHKSYRWECSEILGEKKYNNTAKAIQALDKNTNEVVATYVSISAAAHALNKNGTSLIRKALQSDHYTAYGYKWKYLQGSTTIGPLKCLGIT